VKEADANTSFSHLQTSFRKCKNFNSKFKSGEQVITLQERKHDLLHEYYVLEPKHWFVADFFSITWPHKP
jgi:hypothetical protein